MTDINISAYHIIHFAELIDKSFSSFESILSLDAFKNNRNEDVRKMIFMGIASQILIYTESLRDEYQDHFNLTKAITDVERAKLKEIKILLKPVFKKIGEWKDIKKFRNNVLAHNLRIDKGSESIFIGTGLSGYSIPEKPGDFAFLVKCIYLIKKIVHEAFEKEYDLVDREINSEKNSKVPLLPVRDYTREYEDLIKEMSVVQRNYWRELESEE